MQVPQVFKTTSSSISFRWEAPADTGACPVESYVLYLDDGLASTLTPVDVETIANKAYLREHTVTLDSSLAGRSIRYKLGVVNEIGE